jgi:hypothetical protein
MTPASPSAAPRLLSVACPTCSGMVAVESGLLGMAAECPLCHGGFRLPAAAAAAAPPARLAEKPATDASDTGRSAPAAAGAATRRPDRAWSKLEARLEPRESGAAGDDQTAQLRRASADRAARRARRNVVMLAVGGSLLLGIVLLLGRKRR